MEERKGAQVMLAALTVMLCLSIGASGVFRLREANVRREMAMQQQREMADVIAAMADIEVNLSKLLIASGARQSVSLLGETALLAQHVESGLSRMAVSEQTAGDAMKFAGQMGQYSLALAAQVSDGGMLTGDDERQIEDMMQACHAPGTAAGRAGRRDLVAGCGNGQRHRVSFADLRRTVFRRKNRPSVCFAKYESVFATAGAGSGGKVRRGNG